MYSIFHQAKIVFGNRDTENLVIQFSIGLAPRCSEYTSVSTRASSNVGILPLEPFVFEDEGNELLEAFFFQGRKFLSIFDDFSRNPCIFWGILEELSKNSQTVFFKDEESLESFFSKKRPGLLEYVKIESLCLSPCPKLAYPTKKIRTKEINAFL